MLRFQTKARSMTVKLPALTANCAIQKVAAVELNARLGRQHFQDASAAGFENLGGKLQTTAIGTLQDPIVIVSFAELQLFIVLIDARSNSDGLGEIKWSASDSA